MKKLLMSTALIGALFASSAVAKVTITGDARYRYASNGLYETTQVTGEAYRALAFATTNTQTATDLLTVMGITDLSTAKSAFLEKFDPRFYDTAAIADVAAYKAATSVTSLAAAGASSGESSDNRFRINVNFASEDKSIKGRLRLRSDAGFFDTKSNSGRLRVDQAYIQGSVPGAKGLSVKVGSFKPYLTPNHVFTDLVAFTGVELGYTSGMLNAFYRMYESSAVETETSAAYNLNYQSDIGISGSFQGVTAGVYLVSDNDQTDKNEKATIAYVDGEYMGVNVAGEYYDVDGTERDAWYASAGMKHNEYEFGAFYLELGKEASTGSDFNPMGISIFGTSGSSYLTPITKLKNFASSVASSTFYSATDPSVYGGQIKGSFNGLDLQLSYGIAELNQDKIPVRIGALDTKLSGTDDSFYDLVVGYKMGALKLQASYGSFLGLTTFGANVGLKF